MPPAACSQASVTTFDFAALCRARDEAVLQRFRLTRAVLPGLVPADLRANACRISREPDAVTLHFLHRTNPEDEGTEVFRFSFRPTE